MAVDGETVVVGASLEGSAATGVNGDQSLDNLDDAGAVYVFERLCPQILESAEVVRVGFPANSAVLKPGQTYGPVIGNTWDPIIEPLLFQPLIHGLGITPAGTNIPDFLGLGTLLCDIISFTPNLYFTTPGEPFAIAIPELCSLVGVQLCAQGFTVNATTIALTNALDVTIGTF